VLDISFSRELFNTFEQPTEIEWLETNGIGGWASSTLSGAHSRRYHGLLVAATDPPVGRVVLLSKIEETILSADGHYPLGCNRFPGAIHPQGFKTIYSFKKTLFPVFEYRAGGIKLRKTIAAVHGENTTVIIYQVIQALDYFSLELQPLVAARDFHTLAQANASINQDSDFSKDVFRVRPYEGTSERHSRIHF
jgi:predicted glycogen debranching enzyme